MLFSSWQFVLWWGLFPPWHLASWTPLLEQLRGDVQCWESWALCGYRTLINFGHWSGSETIEADHKPGRAGPVSALVLCGTVVARSLPAGTRPCLCWANTGSAEWGLCWKRLAPGDVLSPCPLLAPWRTDCLLAHASSCGNSPGLEHLFRKLDFFVCFVGVFWLCFFWFFVVCFSVSIALIMSAPTLTRSFLLKGHELILCLSPWVGSGMTAWGKRNIAACHLGHR